ncbi:hypothetical protein RND81_03G172600 [Saponaria officinalis]|uniref:Phospholipid/glycerol acyltransferase domain-containing protein n=1 Tax=Saponaria officinalis TaxID=3572 RepID=A0AAW1M0W8_SAPOF
MDSIVSELEGTLVKDPDPFSYFMLVAFEASGPIRFALLLMFWPIIKLLNILGLKGVGLRLTVFIAVVGLRIDDIEYVGRAVLPKFYMDEINMDAWRIFSQYDKKVVVTRMPRQMVERFVKDHLGASHVIGSELVVNRFGFATGLIRNVGLGPECVVTLFGFERPSLGLGRSHGSNSFMSLCKEKCHPPFTTKLKLMEDNHNFKEPIPVIFHDGRLVKQPKPATALLILLYLPIGLILGIIRMIMVLVLPLCATPYVKAIYGLTIIVKGKAPPPPSSSNKGVLFVCNHRALMDPVILSRVLGRKVPAVTYSLSRVTEIFAPIPTIRLTRNRQVDADTIKKTLEKGDLTVCPEGTTCREPFLLRFSGLFAELTDQIVPVAINYKAGFFHATTARGWKGFDLFCFFMNPRTTYEVTFLDQLPKKATCLGGKTSHEVANFVQWLLGATLGFQCTNFTRKDKYRLLAGNDGFVMHTKSA